MKPKKVHKYGVDAKWRDFLKDEEKQRLAVLEGQRKLKTSNIAMEIDPKINVIMRRAIKRRQRAIKGGGD